MGLTIDSSRGCHRCKHRGGRNGGLVADAGTYVGEPVMDYVRAPQMVQTMIETGASKKDLPAGQIFVRGMFGGALLAFATSIAFFAIAQGVPSVIAGLLFPAGFIIINLLGVDLITGYFALVPLAFIHQRMTFGQLGCAPGSGSGSGIWPEPCCTPDDLDRANAYRHDRRYNRPARRHNQDCRT